MKTKFVKLGAITVFALAVSACGGGGGGGGGGPMAPVTNPITVTCPNGASVTGATTDAANAACPEAKVVFTSVTNGQAVTPDSARQIVIQVDSTFNTSGLSAKLWAGTDSVAANAVAGTVTIDAGIKAVTFTATSALQFGQPYVYTVDGTDTLSRPFHVRISFTTTPTPTVTTTCTNLTVWSQDLGGCVAPLGVQTVGANRLTDTTCVAANWNFSSPCFVTAVRSGLIKLISTTAMVNSHALAFAAFVDQGGTSVVLPFDVNDPKNPVSLGGNILTGFSGSINWIIGNPTGILVNLSGKDYQFHYDTTTRTFVGVDLGVTTPIITPTTPGTTTTTTPGTTTTTTPGTTTTVPTTTTTTLLPITPRTCTDLTVWSSDIGTCVAPLGVQTVGANRLTDTTCVAANWNFTQTCFLNAVRGGIVKVAASTATANGHTVGFAIFLDQGGTSVILPFDVNDPQHPVALGGNILTGISGSLNWTIGNPTGILVNTTGNVKNQFHWDAATSHFVSAVVP